MKHEVNLHEELKRMKNLFGHERGVVISEQSKILREAFDFNKYPCVNPQWKRNKSATGTNVQGPTQVGVEFVYGEGSESLTYPLGNQTFYMKDITFAENGDWYQGGYGRGTFACNQGQIVFYDNNGTQLQLTKPKQKTTTDNTKVETLPTVTVRDIPELLKKPVGNKTGIQAFQDWLDQNYSGWIKKYGTLQGKTNRGYGKFGPNTSKAWGLYKEEYKKFLEGQEGTKETSPDVNTTSPDVNAAATKSTTDAANNKTTEKTSSSEFVSTTGDYEDGTPKDTYMFDDNRPDIQTKKP